MSFRCLSAVAGVLLLVGASGSQPTSNEGSTQAEAQQIYSGTKWYFAPQIAFSRLGPSSRSADTPPDSKNQVFFNLASGTRITYSEYLPSSSLKAFHGHGRLQEIPEVNGPIYRLEDSYTAEHPDAVEVVGFFGTRRFVVLARGTNTAAVLADAVSMAANALANLRHQDLHP